MFKSHPMLRRSVSLFAVFVALTFGVLTASATAFAAHVSTIVEPKPIAEAKFATLEKTRIHYENYGKGDEALVLIHGWTCDTTHWRDQIPALSKQYRVIAIDLPGHGKSDKPKLAYTMDYFARAVDAVMRDAKVKRAVPVGHSMGTPIARQFYRKYPAKTLGIVVVDGVLTPLGNEQVIQQMLAGLRGPNYRAAIDQMFAAMTGPGLSAEAKQRINTSSLNTPQHVIVSAMEGMADPAIWGNDKINVPVLAIMARNPFFPPNIEELARGVAPNMDFRMWEGVGHFLMMEKPKEFNEAVLGFLGKNKLLKK